MVKLCTLYIPVNSSWNGSVPPGALLWVSTINAWIITHTSCVLTTTTHPRKHKLSAVSAFKCSLEPAAAFVGAITHRSAQSRKKKMPINVSRPGEICPTRRVTTCPLGKIHIKGSRFSACSPTHLTSALFSSGVRVFMLNTCLSRDWSSLYQEEAALLIHRINIWDRCNTSETQTTSPLFCVYS